MRVPAQHPKEKKKKKKRKKNIWLQEK